jgi:serine/threonine protein kinase
MESWQALFGGLLSADERERAERHLESCEVCQARLDQAEECGDPLLQLGRQVGDPTLAAADPTLTHVRERLHDLKSPLRAPLAQPADLFFLRPSDRPDVLGMLGHYEVSEVIGQGGMGVVLKAFDPPLHRLVAIKVMAPAVAGSATARRRFTREAQAAAAVCHDHIVTVHGVDEADGLPYMVMQYVAGESLQSRLDRVGPLELVEIVRIGLQTALGLGAAHAQGLIHRDIKPSNLLLENGLARVKITDFGLARMTDDVALTQNGVVAGTPEYMAPEQARGEPVDHRSDLFSLGSVLYSMCTGSPPFRGPSTVAVLRCVSDNEPPRVRLLNPNLPSWLEALIARLLAKDPDHRIQSAEEVARLLRDYLAHLGQPDAVALPELPAPTVGSPETKCVSSTHIPRHRRRWWLWSVRILAALAAFVLAIVLWLSLGNIHMNQTGNVAEKPGMKDHVAFAFRQRIDSLPPCVLFGPDLDAAVSTDAKGMRIARPGGHTNVPTGVDVPITLRGDFDLALGYELLGIGEPLPTYGAGIGLRVLFGEPNVVTALIGRTRKPAGEQFGTYKLVKDAQGKERYQTLVETKALASFGRLRVRRIGTQLEYLVADGNSEYKWLRSVEIGREDVRLVRAYATTTDRPVLIDVRFTDLDIRADEIGRQAAVTPLPAHVADSAPSKPGLMVVVILFLLLLFTLASALGVWLFVRRRTPNQQRGTADRGHNRPEAGVPRLGFLCPACGRKLKIAPELAAKRIKCPSCGELVRVPAAERSEAVTDLP